MEKFYRVGIFPKRNPRLSKGLNDLNAIYIFHQGGVHLISGL